MTETERTFLNWVADRFVSKYGESPDIDFVQALRKMAAPTSPLQKPPYWHWVFHHWHRLPNIKVHEFNECGPYEKQYIEVEKVVKRCCWCGRIKTTNFWPEPFDPW